MPSETDSPDLDIAANPHPGDIGVDWKTDHAHLPDELREMAVGYITAVVWNEGHDELFGDIQPGTALVIAGIHWREFRTAYDELRRGSRHTARTDAVRALSRSV